jgi:hypothetical protein
MKVRTKKRPKRIAQRMIIEATTSDSPVPAFISLLRPAEGVWPMPENGVALPVGNKKAVAQ